MLIETNEKSPFEITAVLCFRTKNENIIKCHSW